jgi:adenosylcobinamide kinase/adenosylcobinamide-phosphate guanylyltransferase
MGRLILILGGARSGKSQTAEHMAQRIGRDRVLYVATARAGDEEMRQRILTHRQHRPAVWRTLEAPLKVAEHLNRIDWPELLLLDCITLLVANVVLALPETRSQAEINEAVDAEIGALLALQHERSATWIVVSNEVGMGVVPPYPLGRLYRDALGVANQRLAGAADEVILMVAGLPWYLKPVPASV